jgi:tetratricopeptide (TPR) repeat protein
MIRNHLIITLFSLSFFLFGCQPKKDTAEQEKKQQIGENINYETAQKKRIQQFPDSVLLVEDLLQWYRTNNRYNEAIQMTDSLISSNEKNKIYHHILGILYYEINDTANAIKQFENAISFSPQISDWLSLGSLYAGKKDPRSFDIAFEIEKTDPPKYTKEACFIRGTFYESMGDFKRAISSFDSCIQIEFSFMEAYREKAICLIELNKYRDAIKVLERAITLNNRFAEGYYWMGVCYEKTNQTDLAIASYQKAFLYDNTYTEAEDALKRLNEK